MKAKPIEPGYWKYADWSEYLARQKAKTLSAKFREKQLKQEREKEHA